jgi:hypothetical protein
MSGKVSDNLGRSSGLTKAASTGAPTESASNPTVSTNPDSVGTRFINTTSGELFVCTDITAGENVWKGQLDSTVEPAKYFGGRGVWMGGYTGSNDDTIDYVTIASLGNAIDFGDLTVAGGRHGQGLSNGTRGVCAAYGDVTLEYITFASTGNAVDFGDSTLGRDPSGVSNGTRGCWGGGCCPQDEIDYITIATTGNAVDFGDLTDERSIVGSLSSETRGLWAGGDDAG